MAQTLTLQGVVRITENGDYNLVLPYNGDRALNGLATYNIEEVFIIVEEILELTTVNIYLPKISDFNGGWNTKIYVLCKASGRLGSVYLNSYVSETYTDFLNQKDDTFVNIAGSTQLVHIVDNNYWLVK